MSLDPSATSAVKVDLSGQNITELCFDADDATAEERKVACQVMTLHAERNAICEVRGLGDVFDHLVELYLSHNNLGSHMPLHRSGSSCVCAERSVEAIARSWLWCDATPSWLRALPSTLQILDLSHNQLDYLMQCTCGAGQVRRGDVQACADWRGFTRHAGIPDSRIAARREGLSAARRSCLMRRYMQHVCPFSLALFFDRRNFPHLRRLNLSHNNFATTLAESQEMEELWADTDRQLGDEAGTLGAWRCALVSLDLSNNKGVASASCFLLPARCTSAEPIAACYALRTLRLAGCAVADLAALSSLALCTSTLDALTLHPTPLSFCLLDASEDVLAGFLQTLILSASPYTTDSLSACTTGGPLCIHDRLAELDAALALPHHLPRKTDGGALTALATSVYAAVLQALVPQLTTLEDGAVDVGMCLEQLRHTVQSVLATTTLSSSSDETRMRSRRSSSPACYTEASCFSSSFAARTVTSSEGTRDGLRVLAAEVAPVLRARVAVDEAPCAETPMTERQDGSSRDAAQRNSSPATDVGVHEREAVRGGDGMCDMHVRPRLLLSPDPNEAEQDKRSCCSTASTMNEAHEAEYSRLQRELAHSQRRQLMLRQKVTQAQQRLTGYRARIVEQRHELERMRTTRDELRCRVLSYKQRISRRKKDIAYSLKVAEQSARTHCEATALRELHARERVLERKERALRKQIALSGLFAISGPGRSVAKGVRGGVAFAHMPRSELLRQEAVRRRLAAMESHDPLAYSPTRFRGSPPAATTGTKEGTMSKTSPSHLATARSVLEHAASYAHFSRSSSGVSLSSTVEVAKRTVMDGCSLSGLMLNTVVDGRGRTESRSCGGDGGSRSSSPELQARLPLTSSIAANSSPGQSEPLSDELIAACASMQLHSITEGEQNRERRTNADAPEPVHRMLFASC